MDGAAAASSLGVLLQILLIDLLLSGDNALLIALACRRLPPEQARAAAWLGAGAAVLLRLALTLMAGALMRLPFLQLLSALPLLVIAMNLMLDEDEADEAALADDAAQGGMLAAAGVIIVSDLAMSIDNVVALAAVSGGSFWLLAFGFAVTVPLIVFGSFGFARLMAAFPILTDLGAALLGWVAGGMIVGDPLLAGWVAAQAPALGVAVPLACAIFVLFQGRFARRRLAAQATRPAPPRAVAPARPKSAPPHAPPSDSAAAPEAGDRWMVLGLAALFAIFGLFLTVVILIGD